MSADAPHNGAPPARKAVLFCPECGHESPVDGDWRMDTVDGARTVQCPDCETCVASRSVERDAGDVSAFVLSPANPLLSSTELVADAWRRYAAQVTALIK